MDSTQLKAAGFSDPEIAEYTKLQSAGFSDKEITDYYTIRKGTTSPDNPWGLRSETGKKLFAKNKITPQSVLNSAMSSGMAGGIAGAPKDIIRDILTAGKRVITGAASKYLGLGNEAPATIQEIGRILAGRTTPPLSSTPMPAQINPEAAATVQKAMARGPVAPETIPIPTKTPAPSNLPVGNWPPRGLPTPGNKIVPEIPPAPRGSIPSQGNIPAGNWQAPLSGPTPPPTAQPTPLGVQGQGVPIPASAGPEMTPPTSASELENIMQQRATQVPGINQLSPQSTNIPAPSSEIPTTSGVTPPAPTPPIEATTPQELFGTPSISQSELDAILSGSKVDAAVKAARYGVTPESQTLDIQDILHKPAVPFDFKNILQMRRRYAP